MAYRGGGGGGISQTDADTRYVNATGDETVAGVKTFSSPILLPDGTAAAPSLAFSADTDLGISRLSGNLGIAANGVGLYVGATGRVYIGQSGGYWNLYTQNGGAGSAVALNAASALAWASAGADTSTDTYLRRAAAGTLSQSNGANAQSVRIYNTTDSDTAPVNYERGYVGWSANILKVATEAGGTGTARALSLESAASALYLRTSGGNGWNLSSTTLHPAADGTGDFGASAARVRSIYTSGGYAAGYVAKTADYTATANDHTIDFTDFAASRTLTLPAAASHTGRIYYIRKSAASGNALTIDPNAAETINGAATYVVADNTTVQIQCTGTAWIILSVS
jgi:hypothetical protein